MFEIPLVTSSVVIPENKFWGTLLLYHDRPHLVNRKITAISQILFYKISFHASGVTLQELINREVVLYELHKLKEIDNETVNEEFLENLLLPYDKNLKLENAHVEELKESYSGVFISVRILYPRNKMCPKSVELVILDKSKSSLIFLTVTDSATVSVAPRFRYEIKLTSSNVMQININSFEDADTPHAEWLADKLFPKLLKWIEHFDDKKSTISSLSCVKADEYCLTYNKLKEKYGTQLVQEWSQKTGTSAQKYVFEDLAIATYLISLWKNRDNIKFVDCGCGNGLLVYLLNQEGYQGFGLDIRKRNVWELYSKTTNLKVETVTPESIFPEFTWIIGNHSDELTPWIPIIALNSSPETNFFVLPCCPYDLNGQKFLRIDTSVSGYTDYMRYIEKVCKICGFKVDVDKLRIPSTKRTCFIGWRQPLEGDKYKDILCNVDKLLKEKISDGVTARAPLEKIRNCTQLDRNLISTIIHLCVKKLLSTELFLDKTSGGMWNRGAPLHLKELVETISSDDLKQLKKECGGLQTLLKNHRYIFELRAGLVKLRIPVRITETSKYKEKPCWFLRNHPDGCLYKSDECGYSHE